VDEQVVRLPPGGACVRSLFSKRAIGWHEVRAEHPGMPVEIENSIGMRFVRQCLAMLGADPSQIVALQAARRFFRSLWRLGYILCRLPLASEPTAFLVARTVQLN
jgi:hypothetical protein